MLARRARLRHPHTRTALTSLYPTLHGLVEDIPMAEISHNCIEGLELPCKKKKAWHSLLNNDKLRHLA